ncbi:predicted protein [Naegleria gruberi]|uniref:Predicted protein n=1 Tax=Naegleria gruberi TaxID=5762 RepID=D2V2K2_NAEGR|nr:uncharacterized protein NAEGRDRAFT_30563 [Naegleria gruberi]EFC49075.1 predicted protein [Naegleria gruberi]|eukprot:XP_002681819.1 predicted protein [Naegleria gruberi strain NEG-M]
MDQVKSSRSNYHHLENIRSPLLINSSPSPLFRKFKTSLPTKIKYFNKGFFNVLVLGISFLILFSAFNILLFYFTEIRRRITASAIVLYSSLSGFSIVTPSIIKLFGLRTSIIVGAFLYALFVLSLSVEMAPVSYTMSTISGLGGSLLWIANGEILTRAANYYQRMAKKERNKMEIDHFNSAFTVIFFAIYQLNSLLGNLISTSMLKLSLGEFWLFLILFIISLFGIILLTPLRNISFHETITTIEYELPKPPSTRDRLLAIIANVLVYIKDTISVILSPKMILFSVIFFYSGYSIAFFYRVLPRVMQKHSNSFIVPWAIACFGLSEVVGSLLFGRLSDKIGKRPVMIATIIFHVLAISSSFATVYWPPSYITYFVPQIICGLADSGLNVVIYSVLGGTGDYFKYAKTSEAFSSFKIIQSLGVCIGIVFGTLFSVQTVQFTLAGVLFISILFYIALDWNFPIDGKRKIKKTRRCKQNNHLPHEPYF